MSDYIEFVIGEETRGIIEETAISFDPTYREFRANFIHGDYSILTESRFKLIACRGKEPILYDPSRGTGITHEELEDILELYKQGKMPIISKKTGKKEIIAWDIGEGFDGSDPDTGYMCLNLGILTVESKIYVINVTKEGFDIWNEIIGNEDETKLCKVNGESGGFQCYFFKDKKFKYDLLDSNIPGINIIYKQDSGSSFVLAPGSIDSDGRAWFLEGDMESLVPKMSKKMHIRLKEVIQEYKHETGKGHDKNNKDTKKSEDQNFASKKSGKTTPTGRAPRKKWTLKIFLVRAREIHGGDYDYSLIMPEHIKGVKDKIPIICTNCKHKWDQRLGEHINRRQGCPKCNKPEKWTTERFSVRSKEVHGDAYEYPGLGLIKDINRDTKISIRCKACKNEWNTTTIDSHINGETGCPKCHKAEKWTVELLLFRSTEVHKGAYEYPGISLMKEIWCDTKISIKCKCGNIWATTTVSHHINNGVGCPRCGGVERWTFSRFLQASADIHGAKYDYSEIKETDITTALSRVPVTCTQCKKKWNPSIRSHVHNRSGCPNCFLSAQAQSFLAVLDELNIEYTIEYPIPTVANRWPYDFYLLINNIHYLVEIDGIQHFKYTPIFHKDEEHFAYRQQIDIEKTFNAIVNNYRIIRIDHKQNTMPLLRSHFRFALENMNESSPVYLSNENMYQYIIEGIESISYITQ